MAETERDRTVASPPPTASAPIGGTIKPQPLHTFTVKNSRHTDGSDHTTVKTMTVKIRIYFCLTRASATSFNASLT